MNKASKMNYKKLIQGYSDDYTKEITSKSQTKIVSEKYDDQKLKLLKEQIDWSDKSPIKNNLTEKEKGKKTTLAAMASPNSKTLIISAVNFSDDNNDVSKTNSEESQNESPSYSQEEDCDELMISEAYPYGKYQSSSDKLLGDFNLNSVEDSEIRINSLFNKLFNFETNENFHRPVRTEKILKIKKQNGEAKSAENTNENKKENANSTSNKDNQEESNHYKTDISLSPMKDSHPGLKKSESNIEKKSELDWLDSLGGDKIQKKRKKILEAIRLENDDPRINALNKENSIKKDDESLFTKDDFTFGLPSKIKFSVSEKNKPLIEKLINSEFMKTHITSEIEISTIDEDKEKNQQVKKNNTLNTWSKSQLEQLMEKVFQTEISIVSFLENVFNSIYKGIAVDIPKKVIFYLILDRRYRDRHYESLLSSL